MTLLKKPAAVVICLAALALGFAAGRYSIASDVASPDTDVIERNTRYRFISPLLECGDYQASNLMNGDAAEITEELNAFIERQKAKDAAEDVAVYFRDLNNGPYVNINSSYRFAPGSLLKVPTAIALYKQAENDPSILLRPATLKEGDDNFDGMQNFVPPEHIERGKAYTLEELARYMLVYSENNAAYLIINSVNTPALLASYSDLGIEAPSPEGYSINVRDFGSFFRVLYNASYLSQDDSERVLSLLSETFFTDGLAKGVPKGVVVSHKFGERTTDDGMRELHDCGVVYKPGQPYVLCIMSRGKSFAGLSDTISGISSIVYGTLLKNNRSF
ncbi:MAG TPA: serine hydrolase [Candidatus Paceibacterota bacterium]|nr:serine hydrolase [Candidatus Paceibacterota bacterium]